MALPDDVARCFGYWSDDDLREGCEDCQRRTAGPVAGRPTGWMTPPIIVAFECEARIAPEDTK